MLFTHEIACPLEDIAKAIYLASLQVFTAIERFFGRQSDQTDSMLRSWLFANRTMDSWWHCECHTGVRTVTMIQSHSLTETPNEFSIPQGLTSIQYLRFRDTSITQNCVFPRKWFHSWKTNPMKACLTHDPPTDWHTLMFIYTAVEIYTLQFCVLINSLNLI